MTPWWRDKKVLSWALYDCGNSAFAVIVLTAFFPALFHHHWAAELSEVDRSFYLGTINGSASLVVMILAPLLGAISDYAAWRKRALLVFTLLGVVFSLLMGLTPAGEWQLALLYYLLASVGFWAGLTFYDALLINVSPASLWDRVSAYGFALGYLGSGVFFAFWVWVVTHPQDFGFGSNLAAVSDSMVWVALWWAVFAIPLFLFVPEPRRTGASGVNAFSGGVRQLIKLFARLRGQRAIWMFLLAYWFYIDAVHTIIRMATDYGLRLGIGTSDLFAAILITQFVAFPAALVFGALGTRWGARKSLLLGLFVYALVIIAAALMNQVWHFYALAITVGLVQGGVQALSRSFYARLIPADKSAEYFGLYNMMGKFAAVLGPFMIAWVGIWTGSPRLAMVSLLLLLAVGMVLLTRTPITDKSE